MNLLERDDLAWCKIEEHLIFLDIANDRYFRLPDARNREALESAGLVQRRQPPNMPEPTDWTLPAVACTQSGEGRLNLADVASAMWTQWRVERRLSAHSFSSVMIDTHRALRMHCPKDVSASVAAGRTIRAFELSRLVRTAADRCLPRSIALALSLARRQVRSQVVLGVKLAPFAAHCWVQTGNQVLNDSVEEVLRYRPILIL